MPVDFNWQEGDEGFGESLEDIQTLPSAPQPHRKKNGPRPIHLGYLLLGTGVALGMALGFVILTAIGQRNARAHFTPIVELEHQALAQGDQDLYSNLFDPEEQAWREVLAGAFPVAAQLYDFEEGAPRVSNVHLLGERAEVEIEFSYDGQPYRRLENMRQVDGRWHLARETSADWGKFWFVEEEHVTIYYRGRDDFLYGHIPQIEATAKYFCERYQPPGPCRVDLDIKPNADWLPFIPAEGARPLPPLTEYRIMAEGNSGLVTLNGTGEELKDSAFRVRFLALLPTVNDIYDIYGAKFESDDARALSAERLYHEAMPLSIVSPRLVGVRGDEPHPLWWLSLHEAIGDVVARRALGPVTAPEDAAYTAWAAVRGDVALQAEQLSGVEYQMSADAAFAPAPVSIGRALVTGDLGQRTAAMSFAHFVIERYGEQSLVGLMHQARNSFDVGEIYAPVGASPQQLSVEWQQWREGKAGNQ